jgi:4-diphosphocytidyl-2-C-methyl-D-erythritol kinase
MAMIRGDSLTLAAPGKLNLFLHVTGRRSDGYHTLESLFVPIDRCDTVTLARREDGQVVRTQGLDSVTDAEDLAVRAAVAFQRAANTRLGVSIGVVKRLPVGGGLGGGSSDAATVLLGLNRLWQLNWSREALAGIALHLGADVPFFIFGQPALATGIGELLSPVSLPKTWFTVVTPAIQVPTASIFAAAELTRNTLSAKMCVFSEGYGRNDLQSVAAARFPGIADCLDALAREAPASDARMTGSGASVFGVVSSEDLAQHALSRMPRGITGFVTRALDRHPLWSFA